jgi:hypothetical protein
MVKKLLFSSVVISLIAYAGAGPLGPPQADQLLTPGQPAGKMSVSDGLGGSAYQTAGTGTVSTPAAVGASPNANGLTISGANINLQPANATNPGALTAIAQTIGGDKTLNGLEIHGATGSVTAPKIIWSGDTDTGFYKIGTGQVGLALKGSTTSASINRKIEFQDLNTILPASGLGTGIFQHAPYSYYSAGLEGVLASGQLHIAAGGLGTAMQGTFESGGANANGPVMNLWKNRGTTPTARVAVNSADVLGTYTFVGSTTSALQRTGAQMRATTTENWSETNRGADLKLFANLTGTATLQESANFSGAGYIAMSPSGGETHPVQSAALLSTVTNSATRRGIFHTSYNAAATGAFITLAHYRGTPASPSAVLLNDQLGAVLGAGYNGSAQGNASRIVPYAAENWTASAMGTGIEFDAVRIGGTALTASADIDGNGLFSAFVGVASPLHKGADSAVADASAATSVTMRAGDKTAGTGNGGNLTLRGGQTSGGFGGSVQITGSNGASSGGGITMNAGSGGTSSAGDLNFSAGTGGTNSLGGVVNINAGQGGSGNAQGGGINIFAGTGVGTGVGGAVTLRGGAGSATSLGGDINLDSGITQGGGLGKIVFKIGTNAKWNILSTGNIVPVAGGLSLGTPTSPIETVYAGGGGLALESIANRRHDSCTLVAGNCTILNNTVQAVGTDSIFCTGQVAGGIPGGLNVSSRTVNTSYVVTSTNVADTSTISCILVKGF